MKNKKRDLTPFDLGYDARSANRWPRSPLRVEIGRPCRTRFLLIRFAHERKNMKVKHLLPVARSANRGRASASPQIWRPSPIFALRLEYRTSIEISLRSI